MADFVWIILVIWFLSRTNEKILVLFLYLAVLLFLLKKIVLLELSWYFSILTNILNTNINAIYFLIFYMLFDLIFFKRMKLNPLLLVLCNIFYCSSLINYNLVFSLVSLRTLTSTLTNGLFLIHPFLLYSSYSIIILFLVKRLKKTHLLFRFKKNISLLSLVALILGGWWAQQELNWNGWWGWDFVEILGLVSFLFLIVFLHVESQQLTSFRSAVSLVAAVIILVLSTKLGVVNSIHAFTTSSLTESFIFLSFWLFGFFFFFKKSFFKKNHPDVNTLFVYFSWLFLFITIYWFFYLTLLTSQFLLIDLFKNLSPILLLLIYVFLNLNCKFIPLFMVEFWVFLFIQCLGKLKRWDYHFFIFLFLLLTKYIYVNFCGLKEVSTYFFLHLKLTNYMNFCYQTFDFLYFNLNDYFFSIKKKNLLKNFDLVYNQNYYNLNFFYFFFQTSKLVLLFNFMNGIIFILFFFFFKKKVFLVDNFKKNNLN